MDIGKIIMIQNLLDGTPPENGFIHLARKDSDVYNLSNITKGFGGTADVEKLED